MKWLITGGCGFIGCNAASHLLRASEQVVVLDNMSRQGTNDNRSWLEGLPSVPTFVEADIRDAVAVREAIAVHRPDVLLHLAAQVAVTTSVRDPRTDFEVNALGTLNLLEAVRLESPRTIFLYSSTNKVYGCLKSLRVEETATRYVMPQLPYGVDESQPLDFYSPYGCSKGVADQYVLDYARIYGLRSAVFRQSCIYGPHQYGVEDQGWVAWMTIAALTGRPITIYGTGKQVRDLLYVSDLVRCYRAAIERIDHVAGEAFNIGGGPVNSLSLVDFLRVLEQFCERPVETGYGPARPGDQPFFVSDIRKAERLLNWRPRVTVAEGIEQLAAWVNEEIVQAVPVKAKSWSHEDLIGSDATASVD
jgi:CDP-paratose 2-epimerase